MNSHHYNHYLSTVFQVVDKIFFYIVHILKRHKTLIATILVFAKQTLNLGEFEPISAKAGIFIKTVTSLHV